PYLTCAVEMLPEITDDILSIEREALMRRAIASFQQLVSLAPHLPAELAGAAGAMDDPLHLAYYIANHIRLTTEQRQEILELDSSKAKLERLLGHMSHELEVLELGRKIQTQAEEQMGKAQREYFLREQLKAIQRELGELDSEHAEPLARARGRKSARASPGGVHGEAGLRGPGRPYVGARPVRLLRATRRAESTDPVFMLDGVEKRGADWRGAPSSALLGALDPE